MITPTDYLRVAIDPIRLAILGHAAVGPVDIAVLAAELDRSERRLLGEIGSLRAAGLLTEDLRLDRRVLAEIAKAMPTVEPASPTVVDGPWTKGEADVLSRFFVGSRLATIPTTGTKRFIVLERLAQEFEPGIRYSEREVNSMLQVFHPDYASLRRYMVDEGLLTRAEGVYWRSGGRFDTV